MNNPGQPPPPSGPPNTQWGADIPKRNPGRTALGVAVLVAAPVCALVFFLLTLRYGNVDGYSPVEDPTLTLIFLVLTPVSFIGCVISGALILKKR